MNTLSVGQLYNPRRTSWPEIAQYNYRAGAHELVLFLGAPSNEEIESARRGQAEFALFVDRPLIVLSYRFGDGLPWSDAPYAWHLVPEAEQDLPSADLESEKRALITVLLVDAHTGILQNIRAVTLSPEFTRGLHEAIRAQAAAPWNEVTYGRALEALYRTHSTEALVAASQHRCAGGA